MEEKVPLANIFYSHFSALALYLSYKAMPLQL
jgi:hypothetical protein